MQQKINEKQILKNYEEDRYYSCLWEKTLKYATKKEIPFEYIFAMIAFQTKSIHGLPYFLILSGRITDINFMYKGISISIIFEMFKNQNKIDNPFTSQGAPFKVEAELVDRDSLKKILLSIKDLDILKPIIKNNQEMIFDKFKAKIENQYSEISFSNFVLYSYMNNDIDIVKTILFDLDLSKEQINQLIYESWYKDSFDSLIVRIVMNGDFSLLNKIDKKYSIDLEKVTSVSKLFSSLFYENNYPMKNEVFPSEKFKLIDFFIDKGLDSQIEILRNKADRFVNPYKKLAETFRSLVKYAEDKNKLMYFNYYLDNTDTEDKNYFFWSLVFINNFDFIKRNYINYSDEEKEILFKMTAKSLNYQVLSLFLNDEDFNLNRKINESIALHRFLNEIDSKTSLADRLIISEKFLNAGSRINNLNRNNVDLKRILMGKIDISESEIKSIDKLIEKYKSNVEKVISFDIKKAVNNGNSNFGYVDEIISQLKDILLKKGLYKSIDVIMYVKTENSNVFFLIDSEMIFIPEENISGNEFTENSFTKVK